MDFGFVNGCEDPRIDGGRGRKRAACEWDPGVVLTLLISRLFRLSVAAVVPVGLWATLLCCPQIHRLVRAEDCGPAQPDWREVRTCRIGEAGTAPTSTAKSRIGAVPPHGAKHACRGIIPLVAVRVHIRLRAGQTQQQHGSFCARAAGLKCSSAAAATAARFIAPAPVHKTHASKPNRQPAGAIRKPTAGA